MPGYEGKWGFSKVFVSNDDQKDIAVINGYPLSNIRGKITVYEDGSFSYPHEDILGSYEIDEPFERENAPYPLTSEKVTEIIDEVQMNTNNALALFSSWTRKNNDIYVSYSEVILNTDNSQIICDQYYSESWDVFNFECGSDQRYHWTWFKNNYGPDNFKSCWIHLLIDGEQGEFGQLFGHANNLGISELWLYAGDKGSDENDFCGYEILTEPYYNLYLQEFATAAWQNYWLGAVQRKYIYEYHCFYSNPCDCNRDTMEGWVLYKVWPMNEYRQVFPDGSYNDLPPEN